MVGRQINSVDEKALLDEYSKMNPMYNYVTTTNWSNAYLLVGVTYSIPLNLPDENKFLEFRIMAGPAYATSASYTLNDTLTIKSSNALAARFLLGAGYKFLLEKHMLISINADMALMEPNFENILVYLGNTPVGVATSIKQPMSTVSIMLNYGYSF